MNANTASEPNLKLKMNPLLQSKSALGTRILAGAITVLLTASAARATGIPVYDHVVVVFEENKDYGQIIGSSNAPYINNTLLGSYGGANYTNYHAGTHPSEPNYVEWFSGADQGTTDDSVPANLPFTTSNLGAKLLNSGRTFKAYGEDLPAVGSLVATSGNYAQKHFPSSYWQGTGTNNIPAADNVPFVGYFPTTAAGYAALPTVCLVIPNLQNDMHDGTVAQGDTWLHNNIDGYAQWARTHNSLLIVTWDEDANDGQANNQLIPTIEVGANVVAGNSSFAMTHYGMLRTLEDMYGLGTSGAGDAAAVANTDTFATVPTVVDKSASALTGANSLSQSITVSPTANLLVVQVSTYGNTPNPSGWTMSWNGAPMTLAVSQQSAITTTITSGIFYLKNPTAGTATLSGNFGSVTYYVADYCTFSGVDTTASVTTGGIDAGSSTTASVAVSTVLNGLAVTSQAIRQGGGATTVTTTAGSGTATDLPVGTSGNIIANGGYVTGLTSGSTTFTGTAAGYTNTRYPIVVAVFAPTNNSPTNQPPTVAITSPATGATVGSSFTINATAADSDGTLASVKFYDGATLLGTATSSPYSYAVTNASTGSHTLTAVATDNSGATTTSAAVTVTVNVLIAASAAESFNSYANGTDLSTISGWWVTSSAVYTVVGGGGVNGSGGLSPTVGGGSHILNWQAQPFQWSSLATGTTVTISMDFQSSSSGTFADDRVSWTTTYNSDVTSANELGLQLETPAAGSSGVGMEVYWDSGTRTTINNLTSGPGITANTWYRFRVDYTKLTATSAGIVGTLTLLDASGNPTATQWVGTVPDTSAAAGGAAASSHFTSTYQYPSFKNYGTLGGNADNASLTITLPNQPPTVAITSPTTGATVGTSFTITATAADSDGTVSKVDFYDGANLLGTATTSPYSYNWTGAATGSHALTAKATDNGGLTTTSAAVNVTVVANQPPTVAITSPANNAAVATSFTITATAADSDGTIASVRFYDGATLLGTATTSPYSYNLAGASTGTHTLTAVATDNGGLTTTSAAVTVNVVIVAAAAETFNSYANGTDLSTISGWRVPAGAGVYTVVGGGGVNGSGGLSPTVGGGSNLLNWQGQPFQWSALAVGTKVTIGMDFQSASTSPYFDDDRVAWTIDATSNTTSANQLGLQLDTADGGMETYWDSTRILLTPLSGIQASTWYRFSVEYTKLTATSAGIVGTLTQLDSSGNPTGTPYVGTVADTSAVSGPPASSHFTSTSQYPSFKNYGTIGGNADNASFTITLPGPQAPTVAITSPTTGATVGTSFTITATAGDSDGTVTKVDFYDGATLLGTATTSPYTYNWTGATTGSHALTAKATDNSGLTTISAAVNVTVVANQPPTVAITSPANNATVATSFTINATAADSDGTIASVKFYDGATLLGTATTSPYSYNLTGASTGTHTLTAVATDNSGATTTSAAVTVTAVNLISYTGSPVAENFDSMGSATTPPAGWSILTAAGSNTTWTASVPIALTGVALTTVTPLTLNDAPTANNNNGYNALGVSGLAGDRCIATAPTGVAGVVIQSPPLVNNSGSAISAIRISYDIKRFAVGSAGADELPGYGLFYTLDGGTTWTNVAALNPTNTNVPNTVGVTNIPLTTVTLSSPWAVGASLQLCWVDDNGVASSPDEIIGLDNVSIAGAAANQPPGVPVVVTPASGATGVSTSPILSASVSDPNSDPMTVTFYGRAKTAVTPGPDFEIAVLPDTQFYSQDYPAIFTSQTQWIVDNRVSRGIVYVTGEGDVVNVPNDAQYQVATAAYALLENPITTGLPQGIPFGVPVGNHDSYDSGSPAYTLFDTYFPTSRFSGRNYYGGSYTTGYRNHYDLFTAGGMDFIVLSLEYNASAAVLTWANGILAANSNRRAIVVSHSLLQAGYNWPTPAAWSTDGGSTIFPALSANPNLFLMLCGHNHGQGRRHEAGGSGFIDVLLADWQDDGNGGSGFLRELDFSPANNVIHVKTYSPYTRGSKTDGDNQFDLSYTMTAAPAFTVIGTQTGVVSGTQASVSWSGLTAGTTYEWYATASDGSLTTTGATNTFTTNQPPLFSGYAVSGTTNQPLSIYPAKILAQASDPDGDAISLTRVFGPSAQGGAVTLGSSVSYTPPAGYAGTDTFDVEISDARGATTRGTVTVTLTAAAAGTGALGLNNTDLVVNGNGTVGVVFRGIPGRAYTIQRSTDMANWIDLGSVTAGPDGKIAYIDPSAPVPQGFYRTKSN